MKGNITKVVRPHASGLFPQSAQSLSDDATST